MDPTYAKNWITDFETFEGALRERDDYASNLASSLALSLDEFYNNIAYTVVSAKDGYGMDEFFCDVHKAVTDYETYVIAYCVPVSVFTCNEIRFLCTVCIDQCMKKCSRIVWLIKKSRNKNKCVN